MSPCMTFPDSVSSQSTTPVPNFHHMALRTVGMVSSITNRGTTQTFTLKKNVFFERIRQFVHDFSSLFVVASCCFLMLDQTPSHQPLARCHLLFTTRVVRRCFWLWRGSRRVYTRVVSRSVVCTVLCGSAHASCVVSVATLTQGLFTV